MYIETVAKKGYPPNILLRESYRKDGRVCKRTIANLTNWPAHLREALLSASKGNGLSPHLKDGFQITRSLPHGHVAAVLGTLYQTQLHTIISSKASRHRDLAISMIVERLLTPCSKSASSRHFRSETLNSSLANLLNLEDVGTDEIYEAMDWLLSRQQRIEKALVGKHLAEGNVVLYDVTSSYYEGNTCILAQFGHLRDKKRGKKQIVIGLICTAEGCPVVVQVFEGNTADPKTLQPQLEKLRNEHGFQTLIWVGDRGLLTDSRIKEDLQELEGFDWITTLRAPQLKKLVQEGTLDVQRFNEQTALFEFESALYPGERLVACRNPLLAEERTRKRQELLAATEEELKKLVVMTRREKRKLEGKDKIGVRVGRILGRSKMGKHFEYEIKEDGFEYRRLEEKIKQEAGLDGVYVVRTNTNKDACDAEKVVRWYKGLSQIERVFRGLKTSELELRPIYHRLEDRVRSHVFICMLAYYVEWHMRKALAQLLFDDDDQERKESQRKSVVEPAKRSKQAQKKAGKQRTESGWPLHSFRTLLEDLATLTKNTIQPNLPQAPSFTQYSEPTPLQHQSFELLGFSFQI